LGQVRFCSLLQENGRPRLRVSRLASGDGAAALLIAAGGCPDYQVFNF
jgi:hypothetical protein